VIKIRRLFECIRSLGVHYMLHASLFSLFRVVDISTFITVAKTPMIGFACRLRRIATLCLLGVIV
jgi:hypothetical protein